MSEGRLVFMALFGYCCFNIQDTSTYEIHRTRPRHFPTSSNGHRVAIRNTFYNNNLIRIIEFHYHNRSTCINIYIGYRAASNFHSVLA